MSVRNLVCAMVVGTVGIVWLAPRDRTPHAPAPHERPAESPWLSKEATAQLIRDDGGPGPLFAGIHVGAPEPSPEQRARIAAFARDNHVAIDFDVEDGLLEAIRFDVTFGGCCGYEGADVLGLRLHRPSTGHCCVCGDDHWIDSWAFTTDDDTYVRGRVRVNRVTVRWERLLSAADVVARADALLGEDVNAVAKAAGDRWIDRAGGDYRLEVPYGHDGYPREVRAIDLHAERGHIVQVDVPLQDLADDSLHDLESTLPARWGRARRHDDTWTWRKSDRTIVAELGDWPRQVEITARTR